MMTTKPGSKPRRNPFPQNDVVVIGNAGIDTNVYLHTPAVNLSVEANFTENRDTIGQAGGYASFGYTRLGWQTGFIGHVGQDPLGEVIRSAFSEAGIDLRGLLTDPAGTSRSVNIIAADGTRKNFYDGKSHMSLDTDQELAKKIFAGAKLAHFNIPNWARHLLPHARRLGLIIACDLQDIIDPSDPYRLDFISYADYLFFSATNHPDPAAIVEQLLHIRPHQVIVVGMGSRGCALGTGGSVRFFPAVNMDRPVVDTNGAGDSLAVGFLTSRVLEGRSLEESIMRGQIAARYCCSLKEDKMDLIDREKMELYIRQV